MNPVQPKHLTFFALLALLTNSNAATYSTGFNTGFPYYNTANDLAGQDGWTTNDANTGITYFALVGGSNFGTLGGQSGDGYFPTSQTSITLSHAHVGGLVGTTFSSSFIIEPSSFIPMVGHTNRDSFNFTFWGGTELLSIAFEPNLGDPSKLEIAWYKNGSPTRNLISPVSQDIFYDGVYNLNLVFANLGPDAIFTATLTGAGSLVWSDTLPGDASANLSSFGVGWDLLGTTAQAGTNFIAIDNVSITSPIPEPSVTVLGMLSLGFLSLRRRSRR